MATRRTGVVARGSGSERAKEPAGVQCSMQLQAQEQGGGLSARGPAMAGKDCGNLNTTTLWRDAALCARKLWSNLPQLMLGCPGSRGLGWALGSLCVLVLSRNRFVRLPPAVAELGHHLIELDVSHTWLTVLGAPVLGALAHLEELDVSFNGLAHLPDSFSCLNHLHTLDVDHKQLMAFPRQLLQLPGLEELDVSFNGLAHLPDSFSCLNHLHTLDVDHKQLMAFPRQLLQLPGLEELEAPSNRLRGLPEKISALRALKILWLSGAELGTLPSGFLLLPLAGLEELHIIRNKLTSVPYLIAGLGRLLTLWLDNNRICYLPDSIVELTRLEELVLQGNQIAVLPENFGHLSQVALWKIKDNPLIQPPYEVCMEGIPYFAAYQKEWSHPHAAYYSASDKNLWRRKAHLQYLPNHRLQILSPMLPVSCKDPHQLQRLGNKLLSVARTEKSSPIYTESFLDPGRCYRNCTSRHLRHKDWLISWDSARLGLQAGLKEDQLQSALSYQHERGKLLYFEDSQTLKEHVFHNLTCLIDIINVILQRDASLLLHKLLWGSSGEGEDEGEGFAATTVPSSGQDAKVLGSPQGNPSNRT
ncbi:hypothetical protein NN561_017959 [Cricetulus griseus]